MSPPEETDLPGNIDLDNRPVVKNADGTISTVRSISVNQDGREYVIPTVAADGSRILSDEEATKQFQDTGKHLGAFATVEKANTFAQQLHEQQASRYATPPTPAPTVQSHLDRQFQEASAKANDVPLISASPPGYTSPSATPTPERPAYSWEKLAATNEFKSLTPDEKIIALKNYTANTLEYLKGQFPDGDIGALERQVADLSKQHRDPILQERNEVYGAIAATPTFLGELKSAAATSDLATNVEHMKRAAGIAVEALRRPFSALIGPTTQEISEGTIPWGKNKDGSQHFEYKPLGNAIDKHGLLPAINDFVLTAGNPVNVLRAVALKTRGDDVTPESLEQYKQEERKAVGLTPNPNDAKWLAGLKGVTTTGLNLAELFENPAVLSIPGNRVLSGLFAADMARHIPDAVDQLNAADKTPAGSQERWEAGLNLASNVILTTLAANHAVPGSGKEISSAVQDHAESLAKATEFEAQGLTESAQATREVAQTQFAEAIKKFEEVASTAVTPLEAKNPEVAAKLAQERAKPESVASQSVEAPTSLSRESDLALQKRSATLQSPVADEEGYAAEAFRRGSESDVLPSDQLKERSAGSIDNAESGDSPVDGLEEGQPADAASTHGVSVSASLKWQKATHEGIVDALKAKGIDPEKIGWKPEAAAKVARALDTEHAKFPNNPDSYVERARDRVQQDLLENVEKTGNPLRTIKHDGTETAYNPGLVASREIGNAHAKIGQREDRILPAQEGAGDSRSFEERLADDSPTPAEIVSRKETASVKGEHPYAATVRSTVARHLAAFSKATDLPLDAAPKASKDQVSKAARVVYDQILIKATGHSLGIGDSVDLRGKPGPVNRLVGDPTFRAAIQERIADRIRQDIRTSIPKDRIPVDSPVSEQDQAILEHTRGSHQPRALALDALSDESKAGIKYVVSRYGTDKGINHALGRIAKMPYKTADAQIDNLLSEALRTVGEDARVIVDPTIEKAGAAGDYNPFTNEIRVSPRASDEVLKKTLIHEKIHSVLFGKVEAFKGGDHELLSKKDLAALEELEAIRQQALAHETVPEAVRVAANAKSITEQQQLFQQSMESGGSTRDFYGTVSLHELISETMTNPKFQKFLNEIKADSTSALGKGKTLWDRVRQLLRTLIFGDRPVAADSLLANAFDRSIDLLKSGSLEDQLSLRETRRLQSPTEDFKHDQERQAAFLSDFAREHEFADSNEMVVSDPALFSEAVEVYRIGIGSKAEQPRLLSVASHEADVQKSVTERAKLLFTKIDGRSEGVNSEQVTRDALESGAIKAEDFAKALKDAGVHPDLAQAAGAAVEAHLRLAAVEKLPQIEAANAEAAGERKQLVKSAVETLGASLGVVKQKTVAELVTADIKAKNAEAQKLGAVPYSPFTVLPKAEQAVRALINDIKSNKSSPFQRTLREWDGDLQQTYFRVRQIAKEIEERVPDKGVREGITNWIQAAGDGTLLRARAAATKDAKLKAGYEAALELTPDQVKVAKAVKGFYDDMLAAGHATGLLQEGRDNYVNQVWQDPRGLTERLFGPGNKITQDFRFAKKATHDSFFTGEQAGLSPITKDIVALMQVYAKEFGKVLATRDFIKNLSEQTARDGRALVTPAGSASKITDPATKETQAFLIRPQTRPGDAADYRAIGNSAFTKWKWVSAEDGKNILLKGDLVVHPEIADHLEKVFGQSAISKWYNSGGNALAQVPKVAVRGIDKFSANTKDLMLSVLSPFHFVQEGTHAIGHRINPFWGLDKLDLDQPETLDAARHGLVLAHDEQAKQFSEGLGAGPLSQRIPVLGKYVNKPLTEFLFKEYIPRLKLTTYNHALKRNLAVFKNEISGGKMDEHDVKALTADQMNAAYGHLNYAALGRDPTIRHISQMLLLAPDFLEARARFTGQGIKGAFDKGGREQLTAIVFLATAQWLSARIFNKTLDDDYHFDHPFSVIHNDREYTMRSVPEDIYKAWKDSRQFIYGRLNPIMARGSIQYLTGRNHRGEKVSWSDTTQELATQWIPIWMRQLPGVRNLSETEKNKPVGAWESFASGWGLQTSRNSPIAETYKLAEKWRQDRGDKSDTGVYPVSKYQRLRYALEDGDLGTAQKEFDALKLAEPKTPVSGLLQGFHTSVNHPFTGTKANDAAFESSLDATGIEMLHAAQRKRREILQRFSRLKQARPSA